METIKRDIRDATKTGFRELVGAIEDGISALLIIGKNVSEKTFEKKTTKSSAIVIAFSDLVETIEASYNLCLQGYYESAVRLLRSALETALMIEKLHSYSVDAFPSIDSLPQQNSVSSYEVQNYGKLSGIAKENFEIRLWLDANREFDTDKIHLYMRVFSPTKMIDAFIEPDYRDAFRESYHKLSQFSHPSFQGMSPRLQINPESVKFLPAYKKEFAEGVLHDVLKSIVFASNGIVKEFPDIEFSPDDAKLISSIKREYEKTP